MAFKVEVTSQADKDIEVALEWYTDIAPHLPTKFVDELYIALKKLSDHPQHYKYYNDRFRVVLLDRFPYSVYFHIQSNNVVVVAVLHHKQNKKAILRKRK